MDILHILLPVIFLYFHIDLSSCYFINIDAHAEECFFDRVNSGSKMSLMFEVAEGGFLDIDVKVCFPSILEVLMPKVLLRLSDYHMYNSHCMMFTMHSQVEIKF